MRACVCACVYARVCITCEGQRPRAEQAGPGTRSWLIKAFQTSGSALCTYVVLPWGQACRHAVSIPGVC